MRSDSETAARLLGLGVATLHEALGRRHLLSGIRLLVGEPFAGRALTVGLPAGDNLGVYLALEAAEPGSIVCGASSGRGLYGVVGEILLEAGRARGVAGFVLDDGLRDVAGLRAPPSIAGRGVTALGTVKRRLRHPVGADVSVGGTLVVAGDWVVCDADGVCVVPEDAVENVIERAGSRLMAENRVRDQLANGLTSRGVLGLTTDPPASVS
jgi:4-hydroxy-4-methyl-2-oxoglutarate aldolase